MVHAINIIDAGSGNVDINVFIDSIQARTANINSLRNLLPGNQRNNPTIVSSKASDALQMLLDSRIALSDMPPEDPAVITDPALPNFFQARVVSADQIGSGGNAIDVYRPIALVGGIPTHLVAREFLVTIVWDGILDVGHVNILTETPPTILR